MKIKYSIAKIGVRVLCLLLAMSMTACMGAVAPVVEQAPVIISGNAIGAAEIVRVVQNVAHGVPGSFALGAGDNLLMASPSGTGYIYAYKTAQGWLGFKTTSLEMAVIYNQLEAAGYELLNSLPPEIKAVATQTAATALSTIALGMTGMVSVLVFPGFSIQFDDVVQPAEYIDT